MDCDELITTSSEVWIGSGWGSDGASADTVLRYSFDGSKVGEINQASSKLLRVGETVWIAYKDGNLGPGHSDLTVYRYDFDGNFIDSFVLNVDGPSIMLDMEIVTRERPSTSIDSAPQGIPRDRPRKREYNKNT